MRMQVTLHRQPQARWSMTSHLQELGRRAAVDGRVLQETVRAVPAQPGGLPARGVEQVAPPGR
jgi:hypothetical protein